MILIKKYLTDNKVFFSHAANDSDDGPDDDGDEGEVYEPKYCHNYHQQQQLSPDMHSVTTVGHGSGPSMGRVGSGHKILRLGWVGFGRSQCQKYLINIRNWLFETRICNDKL